MKHANRLVNMAIEICADSVTELRKCDVDRAMDCAARHGRETYLDLIEFIASHRPDLMASVAAAHEAPNNDENGPSARCLFAAFGDESMR